jgi:transposase InsO family protein
MKAFIDAHRAVYGVEPICQVLPIAPSTYYLHAARQADPSRRSARTRLDERLREQIQQVWNDNCHVYGARKVWRPLRREGVNVARCTVERRMRRKGWQGVVRGKPVKTGQAVNAAPHVALRVCGWTSLPTSIPTNGLWIAAARSGC